jgi:hypothetical protein
MHEILSEAKAIVLSAKKVGGSGARLDVPITHINASYVRWHFRRHGCRHSRRAARRRIAARAGGDHRGRELMPG